MTPNSIACISKEIKKIIIAIVVVTLAFAVLFLPVKSVEASDLTLPYVDREASENAFLNAYGYFMQNRLWNTLDELAEALGRNVYFVDAYYLRSLALRRLGRYTDAISAMSQYLEVRRDDYRGRIILDTMESEWAAIKKAVSPDGEPQTLYFDSKTINFFTGLPVYNPLSVKGMAGLGKLAAIDDIVIVCDTLGDKVWLFDLGVNNPVSLDVTRPAAIMPLSRHDMFLFQDDGTVCRLSYDGVSLNIVTETAEKLGISAADAAIIDSTFFALADRRGGAVRFFEMSSMRETGEWKPPDADSSLKLFEPVAVSAYGPLVAVADRGNGKVFILDAYTLAAIDVFEIETPRDIEWGPRGELYVLNEHGTMYSRSFTGAVSGDVKITAEVMDGAWSMAWTQNTLAVTSVSGRKWWIGSVHPGHTETFGAVTLRDPWIETEDDFENLMLRGSVASTYHDFIQDKVPLTQVVWRGEARPSRITSVGAGYGRAIRSYSPSLGYGPRNAEIIRADTISDVMSDIASISRNGEQIPGVIVLDSRISGSDGQFELFFAFLLQQGIRLDLMVLNRPASLLVNRISRLTLGNIYYSDEVERIPPNESVEWILSVPLPPDVVTFGYPSDTTLSLFSDIDVIRFNDWIPIWPSLIERAENEGVLK
jgi:hypothetical protein